MAAEAAARPLRPGRLLSLPVSRARKRLTRNRHGDSESVVIVTRPPDRVRAAGRGRPEATPESDNPFRKPDENVALSAK